MLKKCIKQQISVFPSTYEPFGIVALEGMLQERPIVVSDARWYWRNCRTQVTGMKSYCGNREFNS